MFGNAVKYNVLQTSKFTDNLSNVVFIRNNIINKPEEGSVTLGGDI